MQLIYKAKKAAVPVRFVVGKIGRFTGKVLEVPTGQGDALKRIPKASPLNNRRLVILMRKAVSLAKQNRIKVLDINWKDVRALAPSSKGGSAFGRKNLDDAALGQLVGTAFVMAGYEHNTYKQKPKEGFAAVEVVAVRNTSQEGADGLARGFVVGEEVNACRELSNTPGGDMTPKTLFDAAKKALKGTGATVKALGVAEMKKLGMGAILGVAKGAEEEPRFIIMEYRGNAERTRNGRGKNAEKTKPIVLIGKGVTFDTGGLNIKTGDHMYEMHMDMSGGAAVIHAVALAAKLKVKANVVGLVPAVENAVSGSSMRPGDILKSLSGKTIEILNTDAEGRVVLADGITYAKRYDPALVVDVATLTGASIVALGTQASAFMAKRDEDILPFIKLGEKSGDYMWPFPVWSEYEEMTKGNFGDVPNISTMGNSRDGGVIAGGMFLKRFYDDLSCPWLHIDMSSRMVSTPNEFLAKGAAGAPVRFLLALIESYAQK